VLTVG